MALSSGQKICYAIILILTILLAGLIFATAAKGYHYYSEDNNFRNRNEFGYANSFTRLLQQIDNSTQNQVINGNTVVVPGVNQQTVVVPGVNQQTVVVPGNNQTVVVPGVNQQTVVVPGNNQQTIVTPGTNTQTVINQTIAQAIVAGNATLIPGTNVQTFVPGAGPYVTLPDGRQVQRNFLSAGQISNAKCRSGQGVQVFGDYNYAHKSYNHFMAFIIVAAALLAIIAAILLIAVCTDCLSQKIKIILAVLGLMLLFALAVVLAIKASQTRLEKYRLEELGCPSNDDLDNFYKLLIAAAVISFVLGALWLALLGHGLLGDAQGSAGGITSTHVNHNVNYDANRVNYVKNSEILYANPPQTNSHIVQQVPVTTTTTYVNQAPVNTYAQAPLNTYAQYPVTTTYETKGYTVPQSADRLY